MFGALYTVLALTTDPNETGTITVTVVRSAGSDYYPTIKEWMAVMETNMLRWTSGTTRFDHIRSEDIRDRHEDETIVEKLGESRLQR